jgi:polysaccharide biosynthesis protein PslH
VKILVLTSRFPFPLEKGDKLRIYNQMRELARAGHEILLVALADEPVSAASMNELKQFCSRVYVFKLTKWMILGNILRNILRGPLPFQVTYFFNSKIKKHIQHIISDTQPDHIYCHLVRMSEYVRDADLPKTLDFMDAFGAGTERRGEISSVIFRPFWRFEARLMRDYEQNIAAHFSNLTIISAQDRARLPIAENSVTVVGNGVDVAFFSVADYEKKQSETIQKNLEIFQKELDSNPNETKDLYSGMSSNELISSELESIKNELLNAKGLEMPKPNRDVFKRYDICFVGNLGYYSNVEAVRFLVSKIFPLLKKVKPDIKILLAGARPTEEIWGFANENISVLGWLEDIREAYANSRILVAPLMHGIGQQNKILEAMAMHVPVVSTSRVNNAIGATPETEILVADTEGSFAEQILRLLQSIDLQNLIADNGRTFVEKQYSWKEVTIHLERLISTTQKA